MFFRNNFHVERLTAEEREQLKGEVDVDFFNSTIPKVVFEKSEKELFSNTDPSAIVASKSLVFEFAFDQKKCEDIDQFLKIRKIRDNVFKMLQRDVEKMGLSMSGLTYVAIPDIYRIGETNNTVEVKKTM